MKKSVKLVLFLLIVVLFCGGIYFFNNKYHFFADATTEWEIFPTNSSSNPMVSQWMSVEINSKTPNAKFYKVVSDDISFIQPWISRTGDQVQVDASANGIGKMKLKLVAYDNKNGNILKEYQNTIDAYYDYSFGALSSNFDILAESHNNGDVKLVAKPKNSNDPQLAKIQNYRWSFANLDLSQYWGSYSSKPEIIIPVNQPGPLYVGFAPIGRPAYDRHGYYQPQQLAVNRIVVNIKKEDGTAMSVRPFANNTYVSPIAIKGDMKLPLISDSITMFSGGSLAIPVNLREYPTKIDPSSIEVEFPKGVILNNISGAVTDFREVESFKSDSTRYRITKKPDKYWGSATTIYPIFPREMTEKNSLKIRLRAVSNDSFLSRNDNWQELPLMLVEVPSINLPKRLVTSFTWTKPQNLFYSPGSIDNFLSMYKKLGFNTVPNVYIHQDNPQSSNRLYTPQQRSGSLWQGLAYGPEDSLFSSNYIGSKKGFYDLKLSEYGKDLTEADIDRTADSFFAANFSFEEPRLTEEKNKWKNAIKYNLSTGKIDMAYDGALLENDLIAVEQQMGVSKPEYLFLDCEGFPGQEDFISTIQESANAQSKRVAGESELALAERIVDEFVSKFVNSIRKNSPSTKISLYNQWGINRYSNQLINAQLLRKNDIIPAPSLYAEGTSLSILAASVRANRINTPKEKEVIPWLSLGTYAFKKSSTLFDEVIHTFLNGASGVSLYTDKDIDDMNDLLSISKAINVVAPYEDIVIDGDNAFNDISNIKNADVSAVKYKEQYLIAVTPKNSSEKVEFDLSTPNKKYQLVDLIGGQKRVFSGKALHFSEVIPSTLVALVSQDTAAPKIVHINVRENETISSNPYLIYAKLDNPASINRVEFFVDNVLIGVSTLPDIDGGFEAVWDTSKHHSIVKVVAYDINGNSTEEVRNTIVTVKGSQIANDIVGVLPRTGSDPFGFHFGNLIVLPKLSF